jgi:hypothetical protein
MKAHQKREDDADGHGRKRQEKILEADDLVISAENAPRAHWPAAWRLRKLS